MIMNIYLTIMIVLTFIEIFVIAYMSNPRRHKYDKIKVLGGACIIAGMVVTVICAVYAIWR